MFTTNSLVYSKLNTINLNQVKRERWFNIKQFNDNEQLSRMHNNVCLEYKNEKKWILLINPENETLEYLSQQGDIDSTKILRVSTKNEAINLTKINNALKQGNCSAVILSGANLMQDEIERLTLSAQEGQTECIVLKNTLTLH